MSLQRRKMMIHKHCHCSSWTAVRCLFSGSYSSGRLSLITFRYKTYYADERCWVLVTAVKSARGGGLALIGSIPEWHTGRPDVKWVLDSLEGQQEEMRWVSPS